jgi:hypothetical protein
MRCQRHSTYQSKDITKTEVIKHQGHKVKSVGTHRKVLLQGILLWNITVQVHTILKDIAKVKVPNK